MTPPLALHVWRNWNSSREHSSVRHGKYILYITRWRWYYGDRSYECNENFDNIVNGNHDNYNDDDDFLSAKFLSFFLSYCRDNLYLVLSLQRDNIVYKMDLQNLFPISLDCDNVFQHTVFHFSALVDQNFPSRTPIKDSIYEVCSTNWNHDGNWNWMF